MFFVSFLSVSYHYIKGGGIVLSGKKDLDRYGFLVNLIADQYVLLLFEDRVAREISKIRSMTSDKFNWFLDRIKREYGIDMYNRLRRELLWFIYTDHVVEPVRLGVYRTLFFEAYRVVHGGLDFFSLTSHGLIRERLDILIQNIQNNSVRNKAVHTGIDLAIVFEYPSRTNSGKRIAVPLFIIGKYKKEDIKKIRLREAVRIALSDKSLKDEKTRLALENIEEFTVVSLLRTIDYAEELNTSKCLLEFGENEENEKKLLEDIPVYTDLVCSIVYPVFEKIPKFYNIVDNNKKLAELTTYDWLNALIQLAVPLINVVFTKSSKPPSSSGGGLAFKITQKIRGTIMNKLNKTSITTKREIDINKVVKWYMRQLNSILEEAHRRNKEENRRMLLH